MSGQAQDKLVQTVAANVAHEMDRMGLKVTQLAAAAGTSERQVYRLLNQEHEPRLATVERFARVFDRDASWFYVEHEREQRYTHEEDES